MPDWGYDERAERSMPERSLRIRKNRDYRRIYARGKRYGNRAGLVYVVKCRDERTRFGFVATKKIGHAVQRNRAKRLMKEVYRLKGHLLVPHREAVMLAGRFLTETNYAGAEKAILSLWQKAGLVKAE